jgi:glycosyltransferase involved in cell wall biosynthesis
MLIRFIHNGEAFLPEIGAYQRFFSSKGVATEIVPDDRRSKQKSGVEWYFMGTDFTAKKSGVVKIHEYSSASTPPFAGAKNKFKKYLNTRPDFRLYLNSYVQSALGFDDGVPFGYRDMGINSADFFPDRTLDVKLYDFVYCGDISSARNIRLLLDVFATGFMRGQTLLVISQAYKALQAEFAEAANIIFQGPFLHQQIPAALQKARYAINFIPDKAPFHMQTSTKLLEYLACKIPVITTDYPWIKNFEKEYGGNYFYLQKDLSNLSWKNIQSFDFSFPDLTSWAWENKISQSGVWDFIQQHAAGK